MFVARIKFEIGDLNSYCKNKIYTLYKNDDVSCKYRYDGNCFEFVLGLFNNREKAFENGKVLYSSLIYLLNFEYNNFELPAMDFKINPMIVVPYSHFVQDKHRKEPSPFYYSNKFYYNNYNGLEIFEVEKDFFSEYDSASTFRNPYTLIGRLSSSDHIFKFDTLKEFKIKYNEDCFTIYKVLELFNKELEYTIRSVLLCIAYETLANIEIREIKEKFNKTDDLNDKEKSFLNQFIENERKDNVRKKCRLLIKKYSNSYEKDKKTFNQLYDIRSNVVHGEIVNNKNIYSIVYDSKILFLKLFREKYKI